MNSTTYASSVQTPTPPPPHTSSSRPLDMKRLLAKPALPYPRSGSESESTTPTPTTHSVSDGGGRSKSRARRESEREAEERERALREISFDGEDLDLSLGEQPGLGLGLGRTQSEGGQGERGKEKRVRNILRRRPSASASTPTHSPSTPQPHSSSSSSSALATPRQVPRRKSAASKPAPNLPLPPTPTIPPLSPLSPFTPSILPSGSSPRRSRSGERREGTLVVCVMDVDVDVDTGGQGTEGRGGWGARAGTSSEGHHFPSSSQSPSRSRGRGGNVPPGPGPPDDRQCQTRAGDDKALQGRRFPWSPRSPGGSNRESGGKTLRAHRCSPSASPSLSPAPSRDPSPSSSSPHHHPHHLSSALASTRASVSPSSQSTSRNPTPEASALTPAGAVVAAYKHQAALQDAAPVADYNDNDTDQNIARRTQLGGSTSGSVEVGDRDWGVGGGFEVIERVVVRGPRQRPHTASGAASRRSASVGAGEKGRARARARDADGETAGERQSLFGLTTGRVVAVGGPEAHHHRFSWGVGPGPGPGRGRRRASVGAVAGGLRELTRKVSGHFRRSGTVETGERERGVERELRGRPSLQEHLQLGAGGERRSSLRLSLDKFPKAGVVRQEKGKGKKERSRSRDVPVGLAQLKSTKNDSPGSGSPASGNTPTTASPNGASLGNGGGSKIWKLMKRISTGGLRERYTHHPGGEAPPVPALPKEYAVASRSAEEMAGPSTPRGWASGKSPSGLAGADNMGFGKVVRRKASLVLGASPSRSRSSLPTMSPNTPPHPHPRSPHPPAVRPSPPSNTRPSTTTSSPSPISSDVASPRFFPGKHSASGHSSASSLALDDVPPVPKLNMILAQHIIPPSELGRMHSDPAPEERIGGSEESVSLPRSQSLSRKNSLKNKLKLVLPPSPISKPRKSEEWMIVRTPAVDLASRPLPLPPPPRRHVRPQIRIRSDVDTPTPGASWSGREDGEVGEVGGQREEMEREWERTWGGGAAAAVKGREEGDGRAESPVIPSFSTKDPINTFMSRRVSTDTRRSRPSPTASPASAGLPSPQATQNPQPRSPLEAPPRPLRSTQRPLPSGSKSVPTSPISSPPASRITAPPTTTVPSASPADRGSTGIHSTSSITATNVRRRSGSYISSTSSPPRRTMTFRELGKKAAAPGVVVLSDQEKAARWEDLLERSVKAGGTLRVDMGGWSGEDGLRSDRLRFSGISEVGDVDL